MHFFTYLYENMRKFSFEIYEKKKKRLKGASNNK